jgi:hypothetical protein
MNPSLSVAFKYGFSYRDLNSSISLKITGMPLAAASMGARGQFSWYDG